FLLGMRSTMRLSAKLVHKEEQNRLERLDSIGMVIIVCQIVSVALSSVLFFVVGPTLSVQSSKRLIDVAAFWANFFFHVFGASSFLWFYERVRRAVAAHERSMKQDPMQIGGVSIEATKRFTATYRRLRWFQFITLTTNVTPLLVFL